MKSINFFDEEGDISLISIIGYLWSKKNMLGAVFLSSLLIGYIVSNFVLKKEYTAQSILTPVESKQSGGGMAGSEIGSMIGLNLSGAMGVNNAQIAMEIIRSKDFFKRLIETDERFFLELTAVDYYKDGNEFFDEELYDPKNQKWIQKPSFLGAWSKYYNRKIDFSYSWDRGGFLTVKFTHYSPRIAAKILNIIIEEVNLVKRDRDIQLADSSLEYLLRKSNTITNADLRRASSDLMQNQLKIKMFAELSPYYLVEPLDSVYTPESPSAPDTNLTTIVFGLIGLVLAMILMTLRVTFSEIRKKIHKDSSYPNEDM